MPFEMGNLDSWGNLWPDPSTFEVPPRGIDIYDSIHGYVRLEKEEVFLLDLPPMQRLRHISQLGLANYVYPGANHTRLEHSIGVFSLTKKILRELKKKKITEIDIDDYTCRNVAFAALMHDIGHFPFSHATEVLISENCPDQNHETIGSEIVKTEYMKNAFDIIKKKLKIDFDIAKISDLIIGNGKGTELFLANLVKGMIDADRMDYLIRDAYHTGIPFGRVDLERLVKTLTVFKDRGNLILGVEEKGKSAIESLIIARSLMHSSVYYHHTKRVAEDLLARATFKAVNEKEPMLNLLNLNDNLLFAKLLQSNTSSKKIAELLGQRSLLKRIITLKVNQVGNSIALKDFCNSSKVPLWKKIEHEENICDKLKIKNCELILDFPKIPKTKEVDFPVVVSEDNFIPLGELSLLAKAAEDQRKEDWTAYVFCSKTDQKTREEVIKYLNDVIGLGLK